MEKFTFSVLISGNGSNLQAMIDAIKEKKIKVKKLGLIGNNLLIQFQKRFMKK